MSHKRPDAFSDFPPVESLPMFLRVEELPDSLQSYPKSFALDAPIHLKTLVRRIERHDGRWCVVGGGERLPGVVVASGHFKRQHWLVIARPSLERRSTPWSNSRPRDGRSHGIMSREEVDDGADVSFRPHERSLSWAQLAWHVATTPLYYVSEVFKLPMQSGWDLDSAKPPTTTAALVSDKHAVIAFPSAREAL
jgi:hypothetical protein